MSDDDIHIQPVPLVDCPWPREARTLEEAFEILRKPYRWLTLEQLKLLYPDKQ